MEEIKKRDAEYDTELERAIKFIYAIASKNQMTEETGHIASMYLQNLEQERSTRYIRNLEEENRILRTTLKEKELEINLAVSKERERIVEEIRNGTILIAHYAFPGRGIIGVVESETIINFINTK